jgi:hypothetical protein
VTVKIGKPNLKRLASLSALGAGALGVTAGTANASTIVYSGIVDDNVGWGVGYGASAIIAGPNGAGAVLGRGEYFSSSTGLIRIVGLGARSGSHGTQFRFIGKPNSYLFPYNQAAAAFPLNARFGVPPASRLLNQGFIARWETYIITTFQTTKFSTTDRYLLFTFMGGDLAKPLYGWAQFSVMFEGYPGPDVTLIDWAYNTSGAQIPAGDTGSPEPSTFALTGLSALALGAVGLRSWRAARKAA